MLVVRRSEASIPPPPPLTRCSWLLRGRSDSKVADLWSGLPLGLGNRAGDTIVFPSTDGDLGRVGEGKPGSLGDLAVGVVAPVGIWIEMETFGLAARPGVLGGAGARSLSGCGAVWHSHGLAAAVHRSDQLQPQLGQPGSMYIGGCGCVGVARPEEEEAGFLFLHWTHVQVFRKEQQPHYNLQ
jgi:hypothetical protein